MTKRPQQKKPAAGSFSVCPISRDQLRRIYRIYLADKAARAGRPRSSRGLLQRLAKEFGVSVRMIRHLVHDRRQGRRTKRFRDISLNQEKKYARQLTTSRRSITGA